MCSDGKFVVVFWGKCFCVVFWSLEISFTSVNILPCCFVWIMPDDNERNRSKRTVFVDCWTISLRAHIGGAANSILVKQILGVRKYGDVFRGEYRLRAYVKMGNDDKFVLVLRVEYCCVICCLREIYLTCGYMLLSLFVWIWGKCKERDWIDRCCCVVECWQNRLRAHFSYTANSVVLKGSTFCFQVWLILNLEHQFCAYMTMSSDGEFAVILRGKYFLWIVDYVKFV